MNREKIAREMLRLAKSLVAEKLNRNQQGVLRNSIRGFNEKYSGRKPVSVWAGVLLDGSGVRLTISKDEKMTIGDAIRGLGGTVDSFVEFKKGDGAKLGLKAPNVKSIANKAVKELEAMAPDWDLKVSKVSDVTLSEGDFYPDEWDDEQVFFWGDVLISAKPNESSLKSMKDPKAKYKKGDFVILDGGSRELVMECRGTGPCYGKIEGAEMDRLSTEPVWEYKVQFVDEYGEKKSRRPLSVPEYAIKGEFKPGKKPSGKDVIKKVEKVIDRQRTWFDVDDKDDDEISFSSREYGDVGSERAGSQDVREGKRLLGIVRKELGDDVRASLDIVDEWVILTVRAEI